MTYKKVIALLLSLTIIMSAAGIMPVAVHAASWDREQYYLDSVAEYGEYDFTDSQFVADEEFFGKWNEEIGEWEKVPYFYYEEYPELSSVEEAAKMLITWKLHTVKVGFRVMGKTVTPKET